MTEQSIYTKFGTVRTDLDTIKVAPERRTALDSLIAAQTMCEASEAEFKTAEATLVAAVRARNDIVANLPRRSFLDELRSNIEQFQHDRARWRAPPGYVTPRGANTIRPTSAATACRTLGYETTSATCEPEGAAINTTSWRPSSNSEIREKDLHRNGGIWK